MKKDALTTVCLVLLSSLFVTSCFPGAEPPPNKNAPPTSTVTNDPSASVPRKIVDLRAITPIAGIPLQRFKENAGKVELDKKAQEDLNNRTGAIPPETIKAWATNLEKVTGTEITGRFERSGGVDVLLSLEPIRKP
jgi:hypothetical protein